MSQEEISWLRENVMLGYCDPKYGRQHAWHYDKDDPDSAANHFPDAVPVEAVLERLFSWDAIEAPLVVRYRSGGSDKNPRYAEIVDPTRKAIIQPVTQTILGVHHNSYEMHQFQRWLIEITEQILGDTIKIGSVGKLRRDALAWLSAEVPETIKTKEGVEFFPKLLAVTAHDGTTASRWSGHCNIVMCDNTLSTGMTEHDGSIFRVRHTRHSEARVMDAHEALDIMHTMSDDFAREVAALCGTRVSEQQFDRFIETVVPLPEDEGRARTNAQAKHAILTRLWREDERVAPWKNTAWGALMAIDTAGRWEYGVKGIRAERNLQKTAYSQWRKDDVAALDALAAVLA